jgi:prepilin-type N-terminal cleavage/methylation domain-containing protein
MTISQNRRGFTLVELLVVIAIIGTLVGLLLPAVQSAREAARRSACTNNMKQLGLVLLNFESTRKRLPAASDRGWAGGGYSWVTLCLPFLEETNLYNTMSNASTRFSSAYSSTLNATSGSTPLPQLVCPSYAGDARTAATATGSGSNITGCPITCYKGAAGVSYVYTSGTAYPTSASPGGGALTLQTWGTEPTNPKTGITLAMVADGTSKTFALVESREPVQSAWIDGTRAWVTAASGASTWDSTNRRWDGGTPTNSALLENAKTSSANWAWQGYTGANGVLGPSSQHQGGIVLHCYVDGHVGQVTNEIDANLYYSLYSRADGEALTDIP